MDAYHAASRWIKWRNNFAESNICAIVGIFSCRVFTMSTTLMGSGTNLSNYLKVIMWTVVVAEIERRLSLTCVTSINCSSGSFLVNCSHYQPSDVYWHFSWVSEFSPVPQFTNSWLHMITFSSLMVDHGLFYALQCMYNFVLVSKWSTFMMKIRSVLSPYVMFACVIIIFIHLNFQYIP
jgi:hypothetical protein